MSAETEDTAEDEGSLEELGTATDGSERGAPRRGGCFSAAAAGRLVFRSTSPTTLRLLTEVFPSPGHQPGVSILSNGYIHHAGPTSSRCIETLTRVTPQRGSINGRHLEGLVALDPRRRGLAWIGPTGTLFIRFHFPGLLSLARHWQRLVPACRGCPDPLTQHSTHRSLHPPLAELTPWCRS